MRNTRREPHHDTTRASAAGDDRLFIQFPIHESDTIKQKSARHAQAQGGNEKISLASISHPARSAKNNHIPNTKQPLIDPPKSPY
jgi:hypothetical protein